MQEDKMMMKIPDCGCFTKKSPGVQADSDGEMKVCTVALETTEMFSDAMQVMGICEPAFDYAMVTTISLIMKTICAQRARGDHVKENEYFQAMIPWIAEALRERGDEMRNAALVYLSGGDNARSNKMQ